MKEQATTFGSPPPFQFFAKYLLLHIVCYRQTEETQHLLRLFGRSKEFMPQFPFFGKTQSAMLSALMKFGAKPIKLRLGR